MILVTGGTGFIGSVLIGRLNQLGLTDIVVVDHEKNGKQWLIENGFSFSSYILASELLECELLKSNSKFDAIYHMGACSSTTEMDLEYLRINNTDYTKFLINYSKDNDIPICYASSAATYGDGEIGYNDDHSEVDKLKPLNPYGNSKQVLDQWILAEKDTPAQWYGVKFFNVYGPNEYKKGSMSSVVFHSFNQINKTGMMKLFKSYKEGFKDGEQKRDFVYVVDVVNAMIELIKNKAPSGLYNLGTGSARTFYDLVAATFTAMNKETKIEFVEMPDTLKGQYQYFTQANMSKLKSVLPGFQFHSLEEGVKDYVQNFLMKDTAHFTGKIL
jgi:ADP-L-glycero-D-manno-heptose 6-epimerase